MDLAEKIAEAGQDFAKTCLRYEDMEIYMFRLYIEYCRLCKSQPLQQYYQLAHIYACAIGAEDREEATFSGDVSIEPQWEDFVAMD